VYLAFLSSAFQTRLAYRGQVWASVFGDLVQVFARIAIWMSLYTGFDSANGVSLREMITYAICASGPAPILSDAASRSDQEMILRPGSP